MDRFVVLQRDIAYLRMKLLLCSCVTIWAIIPTVTICWFSPFITMFNMRTRSGPNNEEKVYTGYTWIKVIAVVYFSHTSESHSHMSHLSINSKDKPLSFLC